MVYAEPNHNYSVALVVPVHQVLEDWAKRAGIQFGSFSELCDKAEAVNEVQRQLSKVCKLYPSHFGCQFLMLVMLCILLSRIG